MTPAFEVVGGCIARGDRLVVDGVDFAVGQREFVALLGANGSGKTTLVRALVGLAPLAAGELRVFGQPVREFRDWARVGYVPQRLTAATGVPATVREVVGSGRTPRLSRWRPAQPADRAAVDAALQAVGLADRAGDAVAALSGGQQQRVLIARALAATPDVLVMDEPTAGVDAATERALAGTLQHLKDAGTAVLLVTHHLGPLSELVDRVDVMAEGHISYSGPVPPAGMPADDHHHPEFRPPTGLGLR